MSKLQFLLARISAQLWVRPTILSAAAILWVALSFFADSLMPRFWQIDISKETLINLFSILASTMLTVATFSVSAVASAYNSVATSATPRATGIVMSDAGVQATLASFLAAFIYAVVSITALSAIDFGAAGRFMLFLGFVLLVGWVLMSFLRWVDRVSRLGKVGDTLDRVTEAARASFSNPELACQLGGRSHAEAQRPKDAVVLRAHGFGYVQHLDMESLQSWAEKFDGEIWLEVRPGTLITKNAPIGLLRTAKETEDESLKDVLKGITVGSDRSSETDPRFAMILLAEVADRALSPAVNDPGTAIAVMTRQLELFSMWAENDGGRSDGQKPKFDRVFVPELTAEDLIFDAFTPIARDGAGMIEVSLRLQKALRALMHMKHEGLKKAAEAYREVALELSEKALPIESQRQVVRNLARQAL